MGAKKLVTRSDAFAALKWWSIHREEFKILSPIARRFLSTPPGSVPREQLFSSAGLIYEPLNQKRRQYYSLLNTELRNIIDKLAQFVARNGPEFEQMTKNKQKGNPKFQFLYGGEYFNYYQFKVTTEQAIFKQQQSNMVGDQNSNWTTPPPIQNNIEIEQITKQQDALREQIKQSEQNLTAQHTVLLQQQQAQVEQAVANARKNANDLKEALEHVVVPMFCNASIAANGEQNQKLDKLLKLWESKANYLQPDTLEKMRHPLQSYQQYQSDQMAKYATEVAALAQQTKVTFDGYQAQHQAFVCHAMQQIMDLQQQKQNLEQQQQPTPQPQVQQPSPSPSGSSNIIPLETIQASLQQTIQSLSQSANVPLTQSTAQQFPVQNLNPPKPSASENFVPMNISVPPPNLNQPPNATQQPSSSGMTQLPNNVNQQQLKVPNQHPNNVNQLNNLNPPANFTSPPI
ncbi:hypothetical protein NQ318_008489 [Aromia moschata]|uniref:SURP motif domain-containing protein n=1 Tax=Aromia moschata TaxID=1265417 RepID=A0AAV8X6D3_9CUCU|nr:hypothetical protein NQ318_008489 [Aromia moschata]